MKETKMEKVVSHLRAASDYIVILKKDGLFYTTIEVMNTVEALGALELARMRLMAELAKTSKEE